MLKQKTLKDSFSLRGKGLHTGLDLTVTFNPAPDNHGYKIQRTLRLRHRQLPHSGKWSGVPYSGR